jgi:hypothetical protein
LTCNFYKQWAQGACFRWIWNLNKGRVIKYRGRRGGLEKSLIFLAHFRYFAGHFGLKIRKFNKYRFFPILFNFLLLSIVGSLWCELLLLQGQGHVMRLLLGLQKRWRNVWAYLFSFLFVCISPYLTGQSPDHLQSIMNTMFSSRMENHFVTFLEE